MGYSSLCSSIHRNPSYNHTAGRGGERVCKITPHHMAARWTGERCAQSFDVRGRNASANYCIGFDGEIVGCVDEGDRSWCSASGWNDRKAITIEVANSSTGGDWPISQRSWDSLVRLCADICRRYGFRLSYTGDSSGSLTEHRMFAATNCPGPYLHARMGELARQVNAMLDSGEAPSAPSAPGSGLLVVDGLWGSDTTLRAQQVTGAPYHDGIVSRQNPDHKWRMPGCTLGWEWGLGDGSGSPLIKRLQKIWGVTPDGIMGPDSINGMIAYYMDRGSGATELDAKLDYVSLSIKQFQRELNKGRV